MAEKAKPRPAIVKKAARFMKHPETATKADIKSMAARILDDQGGFGRDIGRGSSLKIG